ncbi:MAG: hypothetical protein UR98_C0009G0021 [Parcubacteria group bacterium GW2011_GWA1_36_12]|nr:MAG: hypothetical protein UR98_C0009G0021 [Parcubacteria group bacterium GW2011_GWA1_36_12]
MENLLRKTALRRPATLVARVFAYYHFYFNIKKEAVKMQLHFHGRTKFKGSKDKVQEAKDKVLKRYLRAGSGTVVVPIVAEPVIVPAPVATIPTEVADIQSTIRVATNSAPEIDVTALPLLRNQFRMLEEKVKDVGVEHGLICQLFSKLVSLNTLAVLLTRRKVELDLCRVPLKASALLVALHFPAFGQERVGVAVNDVFGHDYLCETPDSRKQSSGEIALRKPL